MTDPQGAAALAARLLERLTHFDSARVDDDGANIAAAYILGTDYAFVPREDAELGAAWRAVEACDTAALRTAAERVEPLLRARHDAAHNGDIVNLGEFEDCDICEPVLTETRAALAAPQAPGDTLDVVTHAANCSYCDHGMYCSCVRREVDARLAAPRQSAGGQEE